MKFYISIFFSMLLGLIVQLLAIEYLSIAGAGPQILLVFVIFFSMRYGALFGELYGFTAGLFLDVFSVSIFGVNSLVFTIIGYCYGSFSRKLNENKISVQMIFAFFASYLHIGLALGTSLIFTSRTDFSTAAIIAGPIYTTILAPALIKFCSLFAYVIEQWSGKTNHD